MVLPNRNFALRKKENDRMVEKEMRRVFRRIKERPPGVIFRGSGSDVCPGSPSEESQSFGRIYKDETLEIQIVPVRKKGERAHFAARYVGRFRRSTDMRDCWSELGPIVFSEERRGREGRWRENGERSDLCRPFGRGTGRCGWGAEFVAQEISRMAYIPEPDLAESSVRFLNGRDAK